MTAKFTPGPLAAVEAPAYDGAVIWTDYEPSKALAELHGCSMHDARLWAASPELFGAVRKLLGLVEWYQSRWAALGPPEAGPYVKEAWAALRKAIREPTPKEKAAEAEIAQKNEEEIDRMLRGPEEE
jgi:hypothetical protein